MSTLCFCSANVGRGEGINPKLFGDVQRKPLLFFFLITFQPDLLFFGYLACLGDLGSFSGSTCLCSFLVGSMLGLGLGLGILLFIFTGGCSRVILGFLNLIIADFFGSCSGSLALLRYRRLG